MADKVSLVLGSAVAAFEEVCPERFDLIHKNFQKLCLLLVDVDEWGQIIIINMLIRYARTQFLNPNRNGSDSWSKIDPDHMLLIRSTKPLLQSRNSGVALAVIQLYISVAPHFEITASLVRPLIRMLHSHYEIQLVILKNIATLTSEEFNANFSHANSNNSEPKTNEQVFYDAFPLFLFIIFINNQFTSILKTLNRMSVLRTTMWTIEDQSKTIVNSKIVLPSHTKPSNHYSNLISNHSLSKLMM